MCFPYQSVHEIRLFPRLIVSRNNMNIETDFRVFIIIVRKCCSISKSRINISKYPDI